MSYLPVQYILFSHLPPKEPEEVAEYFAKYSTALQDLLDHRAYPGLLVLFYDKSWLELLNSVGADFSPRKLCDDYAKAQQLDAAVRQQLGRIAIHREGGRRSTLNDRVRVITADDLAPIVNNLRGDRSGLEATRLRRFLGGEVKTSMYDTAKVVEAIIRVRHIGSGVPVFRIDCDALFNERTLGGNELASAIPTAIRNYEECYKDPRVYTFLFSGQYSMPRGDASLSSCDFDVWAKSFPTRLFPALLATEAVLGKNGELSREELDEALSAEVAKRFYGFGDKLDDGIVVKSGTETGVGMQVPDGGLTSIGANPLKQVISGALLCLSDGAILDLPPFSNFRLKVSWIDDHLKYALHRELEHLSTEPLLDKDNSVRTARLSGCFVTKDRPAVKNVARYTLGDYIPTVVFGCIVDAWIQPDCRLNQAHAVDPRSRPAPGPFAFVLQNALRRGQLDVAELPALKAELQRVALRRLCEVYDEWRALVDERGQSLASLWVQSDASLRRASALMSSEPDVLPSDWIGFGMVQSGGDRPETLANLSPRFAWSLEILIEDAVRYIEWALEWPRFVQSVRSVRQGRLRLDVNAQVVV